MASASPQDRGSRTANETFTFSGKTAIVTGAGSGIGLSFTALLLSRNCNVVLADLSLRPEAQSLVEKHPITPSPQKAKAQALFIPTDVRSWPALRHMFEQTLQTFHSFDIVCPCAGIYEPHWSSFWHPPDSSPTTLSKDAIPDSRYATLDINLVHPIRVTQMALGYWVAPPPPNKARITPSSPAPPNKTKSIIHVSSIAAQIPLFSNPLYGASKAALSAFVRAMAPLEAAVGVRVNAVAPGLIRTPLWTEHPEKMGYVDEGRDVWASSDEVAEAMVRCVEGGEVPGAGEKRTRLGGGTVLEVGRAHLRVVSEFGDPGPDADPASGKGLRTSRGQVGWDDALRWLREDGWGLPRAQKL